MAKSMKKSMKAMKAMKAMKSMKKGGMKKKKAKRVSKIAKGKRAKYQVFIGRKEKTASGHKKGDLIKNKSGKIVTRKSSARGKKSKFMLAVIAARKALGIKGFQPCGGKTAKGQAFLKKVRSLYKK